MSIKTAKEIACDRCPTSERLDSSTLSADWPALADMGWTRKRGRKIKQNGLLL